MPAIDLIHQIWILVDTTPSHFMINANDQVLVDTLARRLALANNLGAEETAAIRLYLGSRLSLLRDIAHANRGYCCPSFAC